MIDFLYNIFIFPLYSIVAALFRAFFGYTGGSTFLAIFGVSFVVSLILAPMYLRAETLSEEENSLQEKMKPVLDIIKRNFKGDERFMLIRTLYRQNGYNPLMSLRTSLNLLIQIPFFIAAYIFFTNLLASQGCAFLLFGIFDLSKPDGAIKISDYTINLMPVVMTLINVAATFIYSKTKLKDKLQSLFLAFLFLILLYNCPLGLVLYWTFNNIFSLLKNIALNQKNPKTIFYCIAGFAALVLWLSGIRKNFGTAVVVLFLAAIIFFAFNILKSRTKGRRINAFANTIFIFAIFLALYIAGGIFAPSLLQFAGLFFWTFVLHYFLKPKSCKNLPES